MIMLFDQEYAVEQYARAQSKAAREEGRQEGMLHTLVNLVKNGLISKKDGAIQTDLSLSEFERMCEGR